MSTGISWADETWNPVTGCTPISDGCVNCYAKKMVEHGRLKGHPRYPNGFKVTEHEDLLSHKVLAGKGKKIFVCDMGDLFHQDVSESFLNKIIGVIGQHPHHIFQLLTKRPEGFARVKSWPRNVWLGVTVESSKYLNRLDLLRQQDVSVKFVSFEPLLGPIPESAIEGLDWAIVGGESGPKARPMDLKWARDLRDFCSFYDVPFWFKQVGGRDKAKGGELLDEELYHEFPKPQEDGRVRVGQIEKEKKRLYQN
ncbi:MAG: DUF5131 family protein [Desulfomonilaceae bacterium]